MKKRTVIATAAAATLLGGAGLLGAITAGAQFVPNQSPRCIPSQNPGVSGCDQATGLPNAALGSPFDAGVIPEGGNPNPECTNSVAQGDANGLTNRNGGSDVNTGALQSLCGSGTPG